MQSQIEKQTALEKQMTQTSIEKYHIELEKAKQQGNFSNTKLGSILLADALSAYIESIKTYLEHYASGRAVRSTIAANLIQKLGAETAGAAAAKVILNNCCKVKAVKCFQAAGQALEDEYKMKTCREENKYYYDSIQKDLNSRGAKGGRKKAVTSIMFKKRLNFHTEQWSVSDKIQAGVVLTELFIQSSDLVCYSFEKEGRKTIKYITASEKFRAAAEDLNNKLEVMQPFFLPMVCPPKPWTGIFDGGYLSPYLKRNKLIKNDSREYLKRLSKYSNTKVYEALNTIQNTAWQINKDVLAVVKALWEEGRAGAGLPARDNIPLPPFPFPNASKDYVFTSAEKELIKKWKSETYEIHKANAAQQSNRLLTSQVIRIAEQFKDEEKIYFPYQLDFRGRMYPIPALLQPQGADLAKGLLRFAEGCKVEKGSKVADWFLIHGANVYGYDKASYKDRIKWTADNCEMIYNCGAEPLYYREWMQADKPFQFLAWCIEYFQLQDAYAKGETAQSHIPIQLDGTCNGLQHYSALLRDEIAGEAVNLVNTPVPSDIYAKVAAKLTEKLAGLEMTDAGLNNLSSRWLNLGINRKLTKRPVMVLPYGGTQLSCRAYIEAYLRENYSSSFLFKHFQIGSNPNDCIFKASNWLSRYLWEAIKETLSSAVIGMNYLKSLARVHLKYDSSIEWITPMGLLIHQHYKKAKLHRIQTEMYGNVLWNSYKFSSNKADTDKQHQLNGICPNYIHSLDASCLMLWLLKCRDAGIKSFMSVHDCYGVSAEDTEKSAQLLREAFVEIYHRPLLDDFRADLTDSLPDEAELPERPAEGSLNIDDVLKSDYFFN